MAHVLLLSHSYSHQTVRVADMISHFTFAGEQVRSLASLVSYLGSGRDKGRWLGIRIPRSNLKPDFETQARDLAGRLADGIAPAATATS